MGRGVMYAKMLAVGAVCCIGGPAVMYWVTPEEGELFKRFNPELQKRNLETRDIRQKHFDDFVRQLQEDSKSNKSIWVVQKEKEERRQAETDARRRGQAQQQDMDALEVQRLKDEIRKAATGPG